MRLQVHIDFNVGTEGTLVIDSLPEVINVAKTDSLHNEGSTKGKCFQLSPSKSSTVSSLNDTYKFFSSDGYEGIITRAISNETGIFVEPCPAVTFTSTNPNLETLYVTFDRASKEYATIVDVQVNGGDKVRIENTRVVLPIDLHTHVSYAPEGSNTITITLVKWSHKYSSAKITEISYDFTEVFTSNSIIDFTCSENALNEQVLIRPGIVEQYAEISLYDRYKSIHVAATKEILLRNARVTISAIDTEGNKITLGKYSADNWDIESTSDRVKVTCGDPSAIFDDIRVENFPVALRSIDGMLSALFSYAGNYSWKYIDKQTESYCSATYTPSNWIKADTLKNSLEKVCAFGMLRIYWFVDTFVVVRCY